MRKLTFEEVENIFEDAGCELLDDKYINNKTKIRYRCRCGEISITNLNNFKNGHFCKKCGYEKASKNNLYSYSDVKNIFEENGCGLLSKKYGGVKKFLVYICECGRIGVTRFDSFLRGSRCRKCANEKIANSKRYSYEEVKDLFEKNNCKLVSKKYKNNNYFLDYICECGSKSKISFYNFKIGQRCKKCGIKKRTGINNHNYNPNLTDEDRAHRRLTPEYIRWRRKIHKEYNYTCQKCKKRGGKIIVHHIESYSKNKELRIDENNGTLFCDSCHKKFHKIYGKIDNKRNQYNEFVKNRSIK